jgi:hypothetical protein
MRPSSRVSPSPARFAPSSIAPSPLPCRLAGLRHGLRHVARALLDLFEAPLRRWHRLRWQAESSLSVMGRPWGVLSWGLRVDFGERRVFEDSDVVQHLVAVAFRKVHLVEEPSRTL